MFILVHTFILVTANLSDSQYLVKQPGETSIFTAILKNKHSSSFLSVWLVEGGQKIGLDVHFLWQMNHHLSRDKLLPRHHITSKKGSPSIKFLYPAYNNVCH